ncbi:MAG: ATP-binding protein [Nitrospirota bacterium]|nr:ATP-binding protein [Nitrospirota bacterium]
MKFLNILKYFNENFITKVFFIFTIFIIIVSSSFCVFFIHHESRSFISAMIREGESLAKLLAYNSRLGVFSENENLLKDPVNGLMQNKEVLLVSIFNSNGNLLTEQIKSIEEKGRTFAQIDAKDLKKIIENLKESQSSLYFEGTDKFEFWAPVFSRMRFLTEETLFFDKDSFSGVHHIIGVVRIILDKEPLNKKINILVFNSIFIGFAFFVLGSVVGYFILRKITKPLKQLTEGVHALRTDRPVEKVPVETEDEIGKLAIAFNDMTESLRIKESEKQLLEGQLRHAQKMEAIGTFAGGIAHDFNNILTAVIGYATLLQMKMGKDDPLRHNVDQILASSERAANLTQSLLTFSRKHVINLRPLNLNEIVRRVEKLLLRLIGEDIELKTVLIDKQLTVMADSSQIEQVLMNLVTNARDAMPDGGMVTISTGIIEIGNEFLKSHGYGKPGIYAHVAVTDTGTGIDEKTKERIFDPFFTTKDISRGTGLGLSIVYSIIQQHSGYIDVSSELGKGTAFKIYLPVTKKEAEEAKIFTPAHAIGGNETILFAEDDEEVRKFTKAVLEEFGYTVIVAVNGEDAITKFIENKDKIQLLLFDVIMPKKNGVEAYEEIMKIKSEIKVIFTSGYPADVIQEKGPVEGLNFVLKPVAPTKLLRAVRTILNK